MKIKAYLKPHCGWSMGVRAIMQKHELEYEDIDIINNRENYAEMVAKSGQPLSPCVEIDGVMLADVSGEEVENYLLSNNLVAPSSAETAVPTNKACSDEDHARMHSQPIRFF
jgi:monothiol glutaredoxin